MARRKMQSTRNRLPGNILNFCITCLIVFVAVKVTDGDFVNSIDKITKNLDVALRSLRNDMPIYTNYTEEEVYYSKVHFNPREMAGLYNLTTKFVEFVVKQDFLMKDLIVINNDQVQMGRATVPEILRYYWLLILVVLILATITVFLPICGFCFCCCRCCGRCGARSKPADKRRDLCRKIVLGTVLITLGTGLLFCVVCAFASNQQLEEGIDQLNDNLRTSTQDANTYLESTKKQTNMLLDKNYKQFSDVFTNTITKSGEHVMQQLSIWSNATAMTKLNQFVVKIPTIRKNLEILKVDTNSLRASASQLNDAMRKVKRDLLVTLENCARFELCGEIKQNISHLQTNIDFNKLPDVSPTIQKIDDLKTDELEAAAKDGVEQLDSIEDQIKIKLNDTLEQAILQINSAGVTVRGNLKDVNKAISDVQDTLNKHADKGLTEMNNYIKNYKHYRYYGGLAVSCVLLLITICIVLGLICGICGKRPDGYSDNCCNKGAGGQFLICAVMIMFIFGFLIGIITLASLALGISADQVGCYPIKHPEKSNVINLLDSYLQTNADTKKWNIRAREALPRCYQNQSIYTTFNLKRIFDVDTLETKFNISSYLNEMNKLLEGMSSDIEHWTILSPENELTLRDLSQFDPSINFDQFQEELKENFTNLSLNEISGQLQKLLSMINNDHQYVETAAEVKLSILHINTYDEKLLIPMKETANKVIKIAQTLDADLKMNYSSFQEAIDSLIDEIKDAQNKLHKEGSAMLQNAATAFGEIIQDQVNSYLYRVISITKDELGQCGPLNMVINATLAATCDKVILPWNGLWITLALSLLIFIPTIIISVKLANLYQKYKQYGQYVETDYLYDAYADRDNVPLNSRGKRNGKKKKGKKYEERPQNMGGEVVTREYAAGSHPPDARYSDMAPKHWEEFPNGGPPQYQRAPTEYERPPPYYYPGSGEQ